MIENAENKAIRVQYRKRMFSKKSKLLYAAACTGTCINTNTVCTGILERKKSKDEWETSILLINS